MAVQVNSTLRLNPARSCAPCPSFHLAARIFFRTYERRFPNSKPEVFRLFVCPMEACALKPESRRGRIKTRKTHYAPSTTAIRSCVESSPRLKATRLINEPWPAVDSAQSHLCKVRDSTTRKIVALGQT